MSLGIQPSGWWTLPCTQCEFHILVYNGQGTGEEAARVMTLHVQDHHPGVDPREVLAHG